ncbi:hypothetical protein INR49_030757 [Caranx melampygus]|nr:hypothetical protein INR49_030757 [Caranx melampygus]
MIIPPIKLECHTPFTPSSSSSYLQTWTPPTLQPVLRVGAGSQAVPQEALHQWAVEGAWVGALPLVVEDLVVVVGLEGQPWLTMGACWGTGEGVFLGEPPSDIAV